MSVVNTTPETFGPDLITAYTEAVAAYQDGELSLHTTVKDFRARISPTPEDYASLPTETLAELGLTALTIFTENETRSQRATEASWRIQSLLHQVIGSRIHVAYIGDPEIESPITEEIIRIGGYSGFVPLRHPLEVTGKVMPTSHNGHRDGILYLEKSRFRPRQFAIDLADPTRPVSLSVIPSKSNLQ
jgi:hypothetical protein